MTEKKYEERQALRALNIPLKIIKPSPTPPGINDDPMALERELAIAKLREQQAAPSPAPAVGELVEQTAQAIWNVWNNGVGPKSWEEVVKDLPGQAKCFREYASAALAISATRIEEMEAGFKRIVAECNSQYNVDNDVSFICEEIARAILKGRP